MVHIKIRRQVAHIGEYFMRWVLFLPRTTLLDLPLNSTRGSCENEQYVTERVISTVIRIAYSIATRVWPRTQRRDVRL
jgi:hypothetical protein